MALMTLAEEMNASVQKYRKDLLMLPATGLTELIPYMTGFGGITYKQTIGELFANSQLRPYNGSNNEIDTTEMKERTLETFLGSVVELFDPNTLRQTVWAQLRANGDKVSDSQFALAQMQVIMDAIMAYLSPAAWTAIRDAAGDTTQDLFNGFDTITATEISANTISEAAGNLKVLSGVITNVNAYDSLRAIFKAATPELRNKPVNMFVDPDVKIAYEEDFMNVVGSIPYNIQYNQTMLHGTQWKIIPMVGKLGSGYIHCSTKRNMIYGYGNGVEGESIEVRRGENAFKLQFILAMFFGVQFATINPKELLVAQLATESSS